MKLPCREKYLDEAFPDWVCWPCGDGTTDIVHSDNIMHDVFKRVPDELAAEIVTLQNEFKKKLVELCSKGLP